MRRCVNCIASLFPNGCFHQCQAVEFFASWHDIIYHLTFSTIVFNQVLLYFLRQCARSRSVADSVVAKICSKKVSEFVYITLCDFV